MTVEHFLRAGKPTALVCHGPAALVSATDKDGEPIVKGRTLYRIETQWLRANTAPSGGLGSKVETVAETGPVDGIIFGPDGALYLTAMEENAVKRLTFDGRNEIVVRDPRLAWPDTFAVGPEGALYVTTSQIHTQPNPEYPYFLFKIAR